MEVKQYMEVKQLVWDQNKCPLFPLYGGHTIVWDQISVLSIEVWRSHNSMGPNKCP